MEENSLFGKILQNKRYYSKLIEWKLEWVVKHQTCYKKKLWPSKYWLDCVW